MKPKKLKLKWKDITRAYPFSGKISAGYKNLTFLSYIINTEEENVLNDVQQRRKVLMPNRVSNFAKDNHLRCTIPYKFLKPTLKKRATFFFQFLHSLFKNLRSINSIEAKALRIIIAEEVQVKKGVFESHPLTGREI